METLNVFLEFVDLPADKKMEYIKKVIEAGTGIGWQPQEQDDKLFIDLDCFKKQLSSLSVTEVDAFDRSEQLNFILSSKKRGSGLIGPTNGQR